MAAALRWPDVAQWGAPEVATCALLAVGVAFAEQFTIKLRYRTETWNFSLTESVLTAGLLLTRPSVLSLAVGGGVLVGHSIKSRNIYKVAFNVGQFLLAVSAAEAAFEAMHGGSAVAARDWAVAFGAMAAFFLFNAASVGAIISIVENRPFGAVVLPPLGLNIVHWVGNVALGLLAAIIWVAKPAALPLLLVPLMLSYLAYRAWMQTSRERDRMSGLYESGRALLGPLDQAAGFVPFLAAVEAMVQAQSAEIVLLQDGRVMVHDRAGPPSLVQVENGNDRPGPQAYIRARPGLIPHLAFVGSTDEPFGVLAVYKDRVLSDTEQSLLDTLASQVAVRLQNVELYRQTVEQRTQLQEIIGHSSDGICVVEPTGRILSWNPAMERMTGFSADEAIDATWEQILQAPWVEPEPSRNRVVETAEPRDIEVVRKDRVSRWIRHTRNAIPDGGGGLKATVVVARDITADLEADQLKQDFIATVSHELRTPLTPLKGFVAALLSGTVEDTPESRREYYLIMMNQANRLERLITDLLEVSRVEASRARVEPEVVELTSLLAEQARDLKEQEPERSIELHLPGTAVFVHADPFRLVQVMSNLLGNALKYSPPQSSIEMSVSLEETEVTVSVRDHGCGIPSSEQERVFERFYRVENGLTRRTGGTGLGLYIARGLVQAMAGRMWLTSAPGQGATFSFSLPLSQSLALTGGAADQSISGRQLVAAP